jgi:lipopolysaccharide/colanic/teichoic acid biosynthesis glycosyltransferase
MAKRLFDIVVAAAGLTLLAPLLLLVGILIKLDSPGPILYRGERVGKDGIVFRMFKLRTMVVGADVSGPMVTRSRDARITRLGGTLRKWKIDELPQLINVLRGEMSMVGPRPECCAYVKYYTPDQRRVLSVRPGITGPAQIRFRHEENLLQHCTSVEKDYIDKIMPQKLALDLTYIQDNSLLRDLRLIFQTLACLLERCDDLEITSRLQRVERPL